MREALRPSGVIVEGKIERGLHLEWNGQGWQPALGVGTSEPWIASLAFVNAHSHLEYRSLMGRVPLGSMGGFLSAMGRMKPTQSREEIEASCAVAATENRKTGVFWVGEHTDRVGSRAAMKAAGLQGWMLQELITVFSDHELAWEAARDRARIQQATVNPHAPYTVDFDSMKRFAGVDGWLSVHCAESEGERELFLDSSGPFAARWNELGLPLPKSGKSPVGWLADAGFLGPKRQLVHCCAVDDDDLDLIARSGSSVAHCPRSNTALGCPTAPVRKLLDRGIRVGLGLDSAASSGPIDFFAEMREAKRVGGLSGQEVWHMSCERGAASVGLDGHTFGRSSAVIGVRGEWESVDAIIEGANPDLVFWP